MTVSQSHDDFPFQGMEARGLVLAGSLPVEQARRHLDGRFTPAALDGHPGRAPANIHILIMRDLKIQGLPLVRFHYPEAVWNLRADIDGEQTDISIRAHTNWMMRVPLAVFDKYNTNLGRIDLNVDGGRGRALVAQGRKGRLMIDIATTGAAQAGVPMIRRLYTRSKTGAFFHIPWGDTAPQQLLSADCHINERSLIDHVFGPVWKLERGFFFINRHHLCAPSVPVPLPQPGAQAS